ncbi:long-chain fatty acid--CoA ligase [Dactylosporangium fulvum]|uniref:Acyl--CoA ligase n=1 Tax=Dactylosporangium fulvum TaxID=53359 RepID=A0ABY5VR26_9ACTN|nr:class I adenylate-forming enzyme family protein [Dactylosporangium fulvum]UWP80198.1 acyl--CoA ligase [Dactylosporangium fulvum]
MVLHAPPTTVPRLLADRSASEPDREALVVDGIGALTFGSWQRRAADLAEQLQQRRVAPGDRVGLRFGAAEWLDYAVAYVAVQRLGAVAVPISDDAAPAELAHMLADCGAVGLVHAGGAPDWPGGWTHAADDGAGSQCGEDRSTPHSLAQILYTSGTTARPKGVAASHANVTYGSGARHRPFRHSRHLLHAFAIGTNAAQIMLMNALLAHPAVVTLPQFTPLRFARAIARWSAGTVFVVPAMAMELLTVADGHDLSSVRLLGSAAAPLPGPVAARLVAAFPNATIVNYYTSTEAAPAQTAMAYDPERPDSVGRPIAGGGVRVIDDGRPCAPGEIGAVWMRSPAPTRTYFGDTATSATAFQDGWVRMGDVGYLDADGYLYLVERDSDLVKTGAHRVSTLQIEAAIHEHPAVADAAVVGLPHEVLGVELAAVIVVSGDAALTPTALRAFLADRLAPHEIPSRVHAMDKLPRNRGGKVDKRSLRRSLT